MNIFDAKDREVLVSRMDASTYDLVIIGGGITGAGIALDAISRGMTVALVEQNDFASGTSSKSTKLIHGGLRYLKQLEIALVREVGQERAIVHGIAPHLVHAEKMLLPLVKDGTYGKILTSLGLKVYDVLAGVEKEDQRRMLSRDEVLDLEPLLENIELEGGGIYAEYRTDDARLTIEVLKTASRFGAHILNYAEVTGFVEENGQIKGLNWYDHLTFREHVVRGQQVISAAGPWVDHLRKKNGSMSDKHLRLTKGVHIVLPYDKLPVKQTVYFDVPDGRMVFAIPRGRKTYVGTTDTDYQGDPGDVRASMDDVLYLLDGLKTTFPNLGLSETDVESSWAGLRCLIEEDGKPASELSRKDEIFEADNGLLSIAGGKLTGYRRMAERIVDIVVGRFEDGGRMFRDCMTKNIALTGGIFPNSRSVADYQGKVEQRLSGLGLDQGYASYLVSNYGRQVDDVFAIYQLREMGDCDKRLLMSELQFCIHHEAVHSAMDFLERRTGRLYFDILSVRKYGDSVLAEMAAEFGWDEVRMGKEREWLQVGITKATVFE